MLSSLICMLDGFWAGHRTGVGCQAGTLQFMGPCTVVAVWCYMDWFAIFWTKNFCSYKAILRFLWQKTQHKTFDEWINFCSTSSCFSGNSFQKFPDRKRAALQQTQSFDERINFCSTFCCFSAAFSRSNLTMGLSFQWLIQQLKHTSVILDAS